MPKNSRNGQAEIWDEQLDEVMADLSPKMRAIFSICRYAGCRISEARQLKADDLVCGLHCFSEGDDEGGRRRDR